MISLIRELIIHNEVGRILRWLPRVLPPRCTLYHSFALSVGGTVHLMDFPPVISLYYMIDMKDFANMIKYQISCFWANQKGIIQSGPDLSRSAFTRARVFMKSESQSCWYTLLFALKKQTCHLRRRPERQETVRRKFICQQPVSLEETQS